MFLTEEKLHSIIRESVEKILSESSDAEYKFSFGDDIQEYLSTIPKDELELAWKNKSSIKRSLNPSYQVSESNQSVGFTNQTVPAERAVSEITIKYNLSDWQYSIERAEGGLKLVLICPYIPIDNKKIESDMEKLGYFLAADKVIEYGGQKYVVYQYEPRFHNDVNNRLGRYLYHITPMSNVESILANGLTKRSENTVFRYPDRIYFMVNDSEWLINNTLKLIVSRDKSDKSQGHYALIQIDRKILGNDVKFFTDPNTPDSVFTETDIPKNAITNCNQII